MINPIRFKTLIYREIIRFIKVINQTILSPALSSFLYLAVFGVILGGQVSHVSSLSYIQFMIPGILIMEVIMSSYSNTSSSLFLSRYLHMIEHLLITPITYTEFVLAHIFGGVCRGIVIGTLIWCISLLFSPFRLIHPFGAIFFMVGISIVFAGVGILVALWSDEFEDLSVVTTYLITPFTFMGGVFYSIQMLPDFLHRITLFNPFFYLIDAFRWSLTGYSEGNLLISVILTIGLAVFFTSVNIYLFKKGYKLKQ